MPVRERPVLVAPDSFKGTYRASQVAGAIGRGLERAGLMPPDLCPVADGGEGTLDALLPQLGGELVAELKPYETGKRGQGDPSRWANERELEWIELRPELVVEVTFDHTSNDRIRHGAKIARWREDKDPAECRMEQLLS